MPRQQRSEVVGGYYHITSRGNGGEPIFADEEDFALFLGYLALAVGRFGWQCLAYCLLPNHYHLVLRIATNTLSPGMRLLNGRYAHTHNRRHGRTGHLFGDRYRMTFIRSDDHLFEACRYVDLNPVRAGACSHPREWRWSSYRAAVGHVPRPSFLSLAVVRSFGGPAAYAEYVAAGAMRVRPKV